MVEKMTKTMTYSSDDKISNAQAVRNLWLISDSKLSLDEHCLKIVIKLCRLTNLTFQKFQDAKCRVSVEALSSLFLVTVTKCISLLCWKPSSSLKVFKKLLLSLYVVQDHLIILSYVDRLEQLNLVTLIRSIKIHFFISYFQCTRNWFEDCRWNI